MKLDDHWSRASCPNVRSERVVLNHKWSCLSKEIESITNEIIKVRRKSDAQHTALECHQLGDRRIAEGRPLLVTKVLDFALSLGVGEEQLGDNRSVNRRSVRGIVSGELLLSPGDSVGSAWRPEVSQPR